MQLRLEGALRAPVRRSVFGFNLEFRVMGLVNIFLAREAWCGAGGGVGSVCSSAFFFCVDRSFLSQKFGAEGFLEKSCVERSDSKIPHFKVAPKKEG